MHRLWTLKKGNFKKLAVISSQFHTSLRTMAGKFGVQFEFNDEITSFLEKFNKLVINEALKNGTSRNAKVIDFQHPKELEVLLDAKIQDQPSDEDEIMEYCRKVIQYSVKTGHPHFFNQLFGGIDPFGFAGEVLVHALNTNGHTYEIAPVFILLEKYLIEKMCGLIGFKEGDGIFSPGGTIANMYGMHMARFKLNKDLKTHGLYGSKPLQIFAQEDCHYSVQQASSFLGIGTENVIRVKTDGLGRMLTEDLDAKIQASKSEGNVPFIVMATAGTTVLGSIDPLEAVADICAKHQIWMHVDAAWAGGLLLSRKYKHLLHGIERADSVAWNPHKMMCAPIQCSTFLVRHPDILKECNACHAEYLFMPDKYYDVSYDSGDKAIQCGRKCDSLSLWLLWKAKGNLAFESQINEMVEKANNFEKKLKTTEGFRLVIPEAQCTNVTFWYIPPSLRGQPENEEWWNKVSKVAPFIKKEMVTSGTMMIQYQPLTSKKMVNFFRIIIKNPLVTDQDIDFIISEVERIGKDF